MINILKKIFKPRVEIPVGGIHEGTIYEKIVRPDGNEPIYKEKNIDETTGGQKEIDDSHQKETQANRR